MLIIITVQLYIITIIVKYYIIIIIKKGRVSPQHGMTAQRGSTCIALLIRNLRARWSGWSSPHPGRFTLGKSSVTDCTGGYMDPRTGLDGCEEENISFPQRISNLEPRRP